VISAERRGIERVEGRAEVGVPWSVAVAEVPQFETAAEIPPSCSESRLGLLLLRCSAAPQVWLRAPLGPIRIPVLGPLCSVPISESRLRVGDEAGLRRPNTCIQTSTSGRIERGGQFSSPCREERSRVQELLANPQLRVFCTAASLDFSIGARTLCGSP